MEKTSAEKKGNVEAARGGRWTNKRLDVSYSKYRERGEVTADDKRDGWWVEGKKQEECEAEGVGDGKITVMSPEWERNEMTQTVVLSFLKRFVFFFPPVRVVFCFFSFLGRFSNARHFAEAINASGIWIERKAERQKEPESNQHEIKCELRRTPTESVIRSGCQDWYKRRASC